jgi:hypothetical protein
MKLVQSHIGKLVVPQSVRQPLGVVGLNVSFKVEYGQKDILTIGKKEQINSRENTYRDFLSK